MQRGEHIERCIFASLHLCTSAFNYDSDLFYTQNNTIMNPKITMGVRILFGLLCLIFGIDKFVPFLDVPPIPGDGGELMSIYARSGFLKIIGALEILGGLALLLNKFIPLAVIVMLAIMFNALFIHLLYDPENSIGAIAGLIMGFVLIYANKERFSSLLSV